MRVARVVPALAVAAVAALLAGCASTVDGAPTTGSSAATGFPPSTSGTPSSGTPSSGTPSSGTPTGFPPSSSSSTTAGGLSETQAKGALLSAAQIGHGFTQSTNSTGGDRLPCTPNQPPLEQQFPAAVRVQTTLAGANGNAAINEQIETYASPDKAAEVITAAEHGLACGSGKLGGIQVKVSAPSDLTPDLGVTVDKAEAWGITSTQVTGAIAVVQLQRQLVEFSFAALPSVNQGQLPDATAVVTAGTKLVAAALK